MSAPGAPTARAAVKDFLDMLAAERGAAKYTIDAYARDLGDYLLGLARRRRDPFSATTQDIRDYLSDLAEAGLKPSSSARKLSAIRQFHRFLAAEERRADDPAALLEGPRQGRRLPKYLSEDEVERLLGLAADGLGKAAGKSGEKRRMRFLALLEIL
jgi:integrase/recombinase XerD